ncbi:hypothetical protein SprV_0200658700 [Sparganum proliferum]
MIIVSQVLSRALPRLASRAFPGYRQFSALPPRIPAFAQVADEVLHAVETGRPVVALESTLLTHGLPPDRALTVGRAVERTVREAGAVPATIAIFGGKIHIGLGGGELDYLIDCASRGVARKASLRDLPFALTKTKGFVYGTTVAATAFAAHQAGISVFATGGIGGVHRGGQTSLDISSDLTALANIPVAVVSAGVKSILDIQRTLEVLETMGVTVASIGTDEFPAFFTRCSGIRSPGRVDSPEEAAHLLVASLQLRPHAGLLFALPIPEALQAQGELITKAIEISFQEANKANITGANVTPFMLERVRQLTGDASLEANIQLVLNNARFASQMAVQLAQIRCWGSDQSAAVKPQILVVGGSNVDTVIRLQKPNIRSAKDIFPPASYEGTVEVLAGGGVARNVAEVLGRLRVPHAFLTATVEDAGGRRLQEACPFIQWAPVPGSPRSARTASYVGILNASGELLFGVADMDIHRRITPDFIETHLKQYRSTPKDQSQLRVVCLDANPDVATIKRTIEMCHSIGIPVWFEPTDFHKCTKIVDAFVSQGEDSRRPQISVISPNLTEFEAIYYRYTGDNLGVSADSGERLALIQSAVRGKLKPLAENWLIKMGSEGVMFVNQEEAYAFSSPVKDPKTIVSVSGAGDSCAGVVLYLRFVRNWPWKMAILGGLRAAELSLISKNTVSEQLKPDLFSNAELEDWIEKVDVIML